MTVPLFLNGFSVGLSEANVRRRRFLGVKKDFYREGNINGKREM
jgi:hypothetical protein